MTDTPRLLHQEWLDRRRRKRRRQRVDLPVSRKRGGLRPGVDLDDTADLLDRIEPDGSS